jgi:ABC-type glycerol-3-phosphate transport system permease component
MKMKIDIASIFRRKRSNRSRVVDFFIYFLLLIIAAIMCFPLVFSISNSLKPIEELFIFPPRILVLHPTGDNYLDLFDIISDSWVPFSRYLFNTFFITLLGTVGQVIISSLAAYGMTKFKLPGLNFCFNLVVFSLMFTSTVTAIPSYIIISKLGWIDTYLPLIVPFFQSSLGLYLLKQFMEASVPDSLIEAAKIDGASHFRIYAKIVMPLLKPGWMTLIILCVQSLWNSTGGSYIYSEELKPLPVALSQLATGTIARTGVSAAITVIMMIIPVTVFLISQSQVLETMSTSGMKE